ncbi:MAG: T9SS type A sorting domain-containing protein [Melioribacteraceae bacterium]|nr:T9SS type A sorting domain-containing protein [Melioribacteraceae bacterium]
MKHYWISFAGFTLIVSNILLGNKVKFDKVYDSTVWAYEQTITGSIALQNFSSVLLYLNGVPKELNIEDSRFSASVRLNNYSNQIYIEVDSSGYLYYSDTLNLSLGYKLLPDAEPKATVNGLMVNLSGNIISNPEQVELTYMWEEDDNNPLSGIIERPETENLSFIFEATAPDGEYYFNFHIIASGGDTASYRTYVTKKGDQIIPFDIKEDHAVWIDDAVIYQITPYNFVSNGKFQDITAKLSEIGELGVNTIYLQPIYSSHHRGQGYDVTDYFGIRSDYGNEQTLRQLITTAKSLGMRVLFDFVVNHSSYHHPFAQHTLQYGDSSYYWDFYQRETSASPYNDDEHYYNNFVHYFDWTHLPNLNHNNEDCKNYIIEAAKYWVKEFGIDGYRFDAVWATTGRTPSFVKDLRLALKRIKPELLMLGEDKATQDQAFDQRFDAAYDWAPEYWWVSHWNWQTEYDPDYNRTVFNNSNSSRRVGYLRNALTNYGGGLPPNAKVLRFMENNDIFRFLQHHNMEQTRMVAALLMTLHGIPMMYNGQEIGFKIHPYSTGGIYLRSLSIKSYDKDGLFDYYKKLIALRNKYEAFTSDSFAEVNLNYNTFVYGYRRWNQNQDIVCMLNLIQNDVDVTMKLPLDQMVSDTSKIYYLTELLSGEIIQGTVEELETIKLSLGGYEYKVYLFADSVETVTSLDEEYAELRTVPADFIIYQNYPNPFNPSTKISFSIPKSGNVSIAIYDIVGQKIQTLTDKIFHTGEHTITFNASNLSSGVYLYEIEYGGVVRTNKMLLIK